MRIMLVEPDDHLVPGLNFGGLFRMEPMALELVAAAVPEHEVKIVDLRLDNQSIESWIWEFRPRVVGVTGFSASHSEMEHVLAEARRKGAFAIAGGCHASFAYESLNNADAVVIGEGEGAFRELISVLESNGDLSSVPNLAWRNGQSWVRNRSQVYDSWALPRKCLATDYRYTAFGRDVAMVEATRGCPHRCHFCVTPAMYGGRYRMRPVDELVNYLLSCPEPFIMFPDPDFLASKRYVNRLLDEIEKKGLKKKFGVAVRADEIIANSRLIEELSQAGLCFAFIGFEGYEQTQQDFFNKDSLIEYNSEALAILHKCDIVSIGTIIVDPGWHGDEFEKCLRYARSLGSDITLFSVLTPFPGTPLEKESEIVASYDKFDVLHAVTPTALPYIEFQRRFAHISKVVFLGKATLKLFWKLFKRKLLSLKSLRVLGRLVRFIVTIDKEIVR